MRDLFFDVVDGKLIGSKRSVRLAYSKIREFTSEQILSCYENYLHLQISLNSIELASYLIDSGLCFDAIDFLNVRAKILLGGRGVYEKVIDGNYGFLSDVRYSADRGFGDYTDPKIRDALALALFSKDKIVHVDNHIESHDELFFDGIHNKSFALRDDVMPFGLRNGCEENDYLSSIDVDGLGVVRTGQFLKHKKDGVCYVCSIMKSPGRLLYSTNGGITSCVIFPLGLSIYSLTSDVFSMWSR